MLRLAVWSLFVVIFSSTAVAQPARAAGQRETRGDPKTTYDQSEDKAHSGRIDGSDTASNTNAVSASSQSSASGSSDPAGHWLVRRVTTSSGSQWTLYESGEIKQIGGP